MIAFVRVMLQRSFHSKLLRNIIKCNSLKLSSYKISCKLIEELNKREMIQEIHPDDCSELVQLLNSNQTVYAGFDPTADSLHVGNLLVIIALLHWQQAGHNVIAIVGDSTAQIGDPSGKTKEREVLKEDLIKSNSESIKQSLERIFDNFKKYFCKKNIAPARIIYNSSWYKNEDITNFLSRVGRKLRVGQMLSRKSIKSRLESSEGMNFAEFTYQVFQSYDWLYLFDKYNCRIQIGGSDQLANIDLGHDLLKRTRNVNSYGLTVPLITAESGGKFGKSEGNAVWLNEDKTSAFDFYQFFMRLPDTSIQRYLKLFTFYSLSEVESIMQKHMEKPENWYAQKRLAENVTRLIHGETGLRLAKLATDVLYNNSFKSLNELNESEMKQIFKQVPSIELLLEPGITLIDLAMKAKCFGSLKDANRIISAGGMYVNNQKVTTPNYVIVDGQHILNSGLTLLRTGKRNYYIVKWL
ncbi:tyrosine--tRNA ligase, mitochondrial-like isoform X1 [Centruroides sculpturatus]|uniref:tyrosine--tRNA ligase, mitochondrial-like isoform X1 n=2 Tax=Centruroides sculpturatus TaxID=218467 RepID=UPI000C6DCC1C|nr:tyrosine--tRNA ligase, mitochondrial-like isoform X1 [Centruroides sculpturatus]